MPLLYMVDSKALLKILLHAAKHPSHSVNGVLLGAVAPASGEPGSPRGGAAQAAVTVADAIPLFHSFLSLAPALETALVQARQLCLTPAAMFLLCLPPTAFSSSPYQWLLGQVLGLACDACVWCTVATSLFIWACMRLKLILHVQVDALARQRGCEVVGYYHANERLTDLELGPAARKIADRIQQRNAHACVLLVRECSP